MVIIIKNVENPKKPRFARHRGRVIESEEIFKNWPKLKL
jgi:hypothetical protein